MRQIITKSLLALTLLCLTCTAFAQQSKVTVKGEVQFSDDPLSAIGVVVSLNIADSTKIGLKGRATQTSVDGTFQLSTTEENIDLTFTYLGYRTVTVNVPREKGKSTINIGEVVLYPSAASIESVVVTADVAMAKVKGDTIQYNAAAFKTNPDGTAEDLLKKLPGVTTDAQGNVESQGEKISKVLVNGKEYFENDPSLALKSLPVDAVENMQLYDDKSDDAKFSGFDDGERIKTVNIVTKAGVMNSVFGKVYAGYGTDNRYSVGAGVNAFTDKHRFTLVAQVNNVNNQGFTLNDIASSGFYGGRSSGAGVGSFTTSNRNGIMESYMLSANYNGEFEKIKLASSYTFNGSNANNWSNVVKTYDDVDPTLAEQRVNESNSTSNGIGNNHALNVRGEWTPYETDQIRFFSSLNYSNNFGVSTSESTTTLADLLSNASSSDYETKLDRLSGSANLWWTHRLPKAGRTFSVNAGISGNKDFGDRDQHSLYTTRPNSLSDFVIDTINQIGSLISSGYTLRGGVTYNEPLSQRSILSVNYNVNYDKTISNQQGLNWDKAVQDYILEDTATTNYLSRNYTTQKVGLGYNYSLDKTLRLNVNLSYQTATTNNFQKTLNPNSPYIDNYTFEAILPSVRLNYMPKQGQNLNLEYSARSGFPSVSQLQTVLDNSNPLNVSIGNPELDQSYSHSLRLRYYLADIANNVNFGIFANATATSNYIANERYFLANDTVVEGTTLVKGAEFTKPTNLQGYYNTALMANFGFGLNFMKSNMNISAYHRFSRTPYKSGGYEYFTNSHRFGGTVAITSNISESVDFTVRYMPGVTLSESEAQTKTGTGSFDRYLSQNVSLYANVYLGKYIFLNADLTWNNSFGTLEAYNQHYIMLNAAIGAKMFKNRQGELKLSVYDALGQNQSYIQSVMSGYTQISQSQILERYFMLSFTYKIDTRKNKSSNKRESNKYARPMHDGGGPGGGGRRMMM